MPPAPFFYSFPAGYATKMIIALIIVIVTSFKQSQRADRVCVHVSGTRPCKLHVIRLIRPTATKKAPVTLMCVATNLLAGCCKPCLCVVCCLRDRRRFRYVTPTYTKLFQIMKAINLHVRSQKTVIK